MQSFKPTLNGCKALFPWVYRPGTLPSLSIRATRAARCPLAPTSHPDLLQSQRASTVVAQRPLELPGPEQELPKLKPSLLPAAPSPARAPAHKVAAAFHSYCLKAKRWVHFCLPKGRFLGRGSKSGQHSALAASPLS